MQATSVCFTAAVGGFLSLAALGIGAAVDMPATLMSRADYHHQKNAIEAGMRLEIGRCRALHGIERAVCKAEIRASQRVEIAQLQARYHGTVAAAEDARAARARAAYEVAKARCGASRGDQRLACVSAAREAMTQSLAQARLATT